MYNAFFFGDIDVTVIILNLFVVFFFGLIIYLRREDRREGYPLEDELSGRPEAAGGLFFAASPKTFIMGPGLDNVIKPNSVPEGQPATARRTSRPAGSPLEPVGDPMLAGVGPGSFAERAHHPDRMFDGQPKIVPMRVAHEYNLDDRDGDPRGLKIVGADGVAGGVVSDVWIDRSEVMVRYLEVALTSIDGAGLAAPKHVLIPMTMAEIKASQSLVKVNAILGAQFAGAPSLANPDEVTFYEEERTVAYYGAGYLYATPDRGEPWL